MKLTKQKAEYWKQESMKEHIERCARVCYKSEEKATDDSAGKFVNRLIKSKHHAMLEHGTIYLTMQSGREKREDDAINFFILDPYSRVNIEPEDSNIIYVTTNYRVFFNMPIDCYEWICKKTEHHVERYTMFLTTSIGIVRELLRHRHFSFANESTRYCNYNKGKFGGEITFIEPWWINDKREFKNSEAYSNAYELFCSACEEAEGYYQALIEEGFNPQDAREFLPLCTKSDIVMTGFIEDWEYFMKLRLLGETGAPHPDMKILASLIDEEFKKEIYNKLND